MALFRVVHENIAFAHVVFVKIRVDRFRSSVAKKAYVSVLSSPEAGGRGNFGEILWSIRRKLDFSNKLSLGSERETADG